jgi:protein NUD1
MEKPWLDSLSEDWISQPRSDGSQANTTNGPVEPHKGRGSSRIPLLSSRKKSTPMYSDNSQLPLNERSLNNNNIPATQRTSNRPSKLKQDIGNKTQDMGALRTVSGSTVGSIQHHTVRHKSLNVSPQKSKHGQNTPEWKRRLLLGEVTYGEQRDLFSPAGLENIFRPPPPLANPSSFKVPEPIQNEESIMPSSPPPYRIDNQSQPRFTSIENKGEEDKSASRESRTLKYRMVDASSQNFSEDSLSRSSSFHPPFSTLEKAMSETKENILSDGAYGQLGLNSEPSINMQRGRVLSGQSDIRHEDLSPIYISRHNTVDGRIDYSALDLPAAELQQRLENLTVDSKSTSPMSSEGGSQLLPANEFDESENFTQIGTFVNLGRGGESQDGSFRQRMLSPSSLPPVDESAMLREASVEASTPKNLPSFEKPPQHDASEMPSSSSVSPKAPRAPNPSPIKDEGSHSRPESGSPLKLFGTYDTFTNQKLLRRLSQFENSMPQDSSWANLGSSKLREPEIESTNHTKMNEGFIAPSSLSKHNQPPSRNITRFGNGGLDQFEFSEESLESNRGTTTTVEESFIASSQPPGSHTGFNFHLEASPTLETGTAGQWRTRRINTTLKKRIITTRRSIRSKADDIDNSPSLPISQQPEILDTPRKRNGDSGGKRLLHSPPKNPTPKRRRTLHTTDISHDVFGGRTSDFVKESHEQIQSVIGKKRKDARNGDNQRAADPQILAMRQILRPRNPTPSQHNIQNLKHGGTLNSHGIGSGVNLEQREKIARVQAELDATAPSGISGTTAIGNPMQSDSRKGSVTTQDFLNEAKEIMAGIRGKARPSSGLVSVEESESEHGKGYPIAQEINEDDSYEESTKEPFSRPPSREGGPLPRLLQRQQDPGVLDHLKKYEEMSDTDGIIASSLKPIGFAKDSIIATKDINRHTDESVNKVHNQDLDLDIHQSFQSDPPNIRITEYPELQRKRKHSTSSAPTGNNSKHDAEFPSQSSNESSGPSTGRSVPTGSSRGSESKHIIALHTVSHLIPEQLAGMIFDREKRIWVKQKLVSGEQEFNDMLHPEDTDDDPFGDIPDLTVDETQELSRIKAVTAHRWEEAQLPEVQRYQNYKQDIDQSISNILAPKEENARASSTDSTNSTDPSKVYRAASSTTALNTRLTSWMNVSEVPGRPLSSIALEQASELQGPAQELVEGVEEEISIHESRVESKRYTPRRRNVTISFSSPLTSIIPPDEYHGSRSDEHEISGNDSIIIPESTRRRSNSSQARSVQKPGSRKLSITSRNFLARPVSRIDERDEESFMAGVEDDGPKRSVSIVISTPLPGRTSASLGTMVPASSAARYSESILQLTPLSDFSMNQANESFTLEVGYTDQRRRRDSSSMGKRSLSLSVKELVQRITDIEPYEPFWEHIKKIELRSKRLQTLHMLSKFCSQLEELDVSDNEIGQLDGAPGTIRNLRIVRNRLTDLSSWIHLSNLQYVDISDNGVTSLEGFKNLVHLRSLRADNNKIQCLKGIASLDALISLRLRGNMVQYVDFAGSLLHRLTDLDLKGNCLQEIRNLQELRSLTTLNLEDNDIQLFSSDNCQTMWALKYLKLGGNKLEHLDVTQYPNIRLLYLDRNRLGRVSGLQRAKHLDSLSLREQQLDANIDQSFLNEALEVRKLFLSGNLFTRFQASTDFLNLQYLELANCGLETLPIGFGRMTPNLRVLNLNFNAIRDIKPLLGIVRLKKLHLAGNRLTRLRKTSNVLAQFSSLTKVDLRNNPLTLGFYPPPLEKRLVIHNGIDDEPDILLTDPFTLPDGDQESDAAYAGRLDMETRMRRRVYEMLVMGGCVRLKMLDGLLTNGINVAVKDVVWDELVKVELIFQSINDAQGSTIEAHTCEAVVEGAEEDQEGVLNGDPQVDRHSEFALEEQWQAEDSFA